MNEPQESDTAPSIQLPRELDMAEPEARTPGLRVLLEEITHQALLIGVALTENYKG